MKFVTELNGYWVISNTPLVKILYYLILFLICFPVCFLVLLAQIYSGNLELPERRSALYQVNLNACKVHEINDIRSPVIETVSGNQAVYDIAPGVHILGKTWYNVENGWVDCI